jgi:hypothetical protein
MQKEGLNLHSGKHILVSFPVVQACIVCPRESPHWRPVRRSSPAQSDAVEEEE